MEINKSQYDMNIRGGRQRLNWLDALKGFAVLSVVLGHVLLGYENQQIFREYLSIQIARNWIYTWHMPLFLFLSGFAYSLSCLNNGNINILKIKKNTLKILCIYLLFSILLGGLKTVFASFVDNPMNLKDTILSIFIPTNIMWYLWVLIIYYNFFVLIRAFLKYDFLVLFILFMLSLFVNITIYNHPLALGVKNLLIYAVFFYIGFLTKKYFDRFKKFLSKKYTIYSALFALIIAFFYLFNYSIIKNNMIVKVIINYLSSFSIIAFLIAFFYTYRSTNNRCLINLGLASLVIYLSHTYIVTAIKYIVVYFAFKHPIFVVLFTWIIGTGISYFIYILSKRNKYIGYLFNPLSLLIDLRRIKPLNREKDSCHNNNITEDGR